jgi:hypothetical protein
MSIIRPLASSSNKAWRSLAQLLIVSLNDCERTSLFAASVGSLGDK